VLKRRSREAGEGSTLILTRLNLALLDFATLSCKGRGFGGSLQILVSG
jgi:hypothetical protein